MAQGAGNNERTGEDDVGGDGARQEGTRSRFRAVGTRFDIRSAETS